MSLGIPMTQNESLSFNVADVDDGGGDKFTPYTGEATIQFISGSTSNAVIGPDGNLTGTFVAVWEGVAPEKIKGRAFKTYYDFPNKKWALKKDFEQLGAVFTANGGIQLAPAQNKYATATIIMGKPNAAGKSYLRITKITAAEAPARAGGPTPL